MRVEASTADSGFKDVCTDRYHCGNPPRSGIALWYINESTAGYCSLGFTARTSGAASSTWVITAGHCATGIDQTWGHGGQYFGPLRSWYEGTWGGYSVDVARIRVANPYWSVGGYLYTETNPNALVEVDYAITVRSTIALNDGVCLDAVHGAICGVVTNLNDGGYVQVNVDGCGGDSGGAWYWPGGAAGRWAYGIHHGSVDRGCHVSGSTSRFTAVPDINAFWDNCDAIGANLRIEYH